MRPLPLCCSSVIELVLNPASSVSNCLVWSSSSFSSPTASAAASSSASRPYSGHSAANNMKRRNALLDGKPRRPVKRQNKIPEGLYGSTLVYVKLLLLWALVLFADHFLEFRFEYLWPFWLFLRSVYDSFKYQGLAFSVFFVCIALTSDMICFLFIPVHWLFFAASTYVWVQYVWHTEKGICLPTVFLWLLFVYIEASIRLKEFKAQIDLRNLPFHLDLCRPFAAHCIGYPVVTLGFGFKTYVGYRMRQRKQKEVQKVNEFYYEFLRDALPPGPIRDEAFNANPSPTPSLEDARISESSVISPLSTLANAGVQGSQGPASSVNSTPNGSFINSSFNLGVANGTSQSGTPSSGSPIMGSDSRPKSLNNNEGHCGANGSPGSGAEIPQKLTSPTRLMGNGVQTSGSAVNGGSGQNGDLDYMDRMREEGSLVDDHGSSSSKTGGSGKKAWPSGPLSSSSRDSSRKNKDKVQTKEEQISKLEAETKRLKNDMQISRNKENDLRQQVVTLLSSERSLKAEISNLQVEKSVLESRISNLVSTRAGEKATLSTLEKKLADERKQKTDYQMKLESERKNKKEAANAERQAQQVQTRSEVSKLETDIKMLKVELQTVRDRCQVAENEAYMLKKVAERHGDPRTLYVNLTKMKDKNMQIEKSLSEETKIKMDLFSALGEARRELSLKDQEMVAKDKEIKDLKLQIAEILAVMPPSSSGSVGKSSSGLNGSADGVVGAGLTFPSTTTPSTLSLDLPLATDLSSFNGTKMQTGLGLVNLEDQLMTSDTSTVAGAPGSLYTSAYSRTNGNTD